MRGHDINFTANSSAHSPDASYPDFSLVDGGANKIRGVITSAIAPNRSTWGVQIRETVASLSQPNDVEITTNSNFSSGPFSDTTASPAFARVSTNFGGVNWNTKYVCTNQSPGCSLQISDTTGGSKWFTVNTGGCLQIQNSAKNANLWQLCDNGQVQTFADQVPSTAAVGNLGSASNPYGNLFLGTAATNNFKFQPGATAAPRTISMLDPLSNVSLPYLSGPLTPGDGVKIGNSAGVLVDSGSPIAGLFTGVNVTPVTSSGGSTTNDQNLMAITIPAGALNSVSRTLLVQLAGVYSTPAASTTAVNLKLKLCTVSGCGSGTVLTLANISSAALAGIQATNDPFNLTFNITTQTAGATASFEAHGNLTIDISALTTAAEGVFADGNTATIGTIDTTAQLFLQTTVAFTAASASNVATQRQMIADTVD